MRSLKRMRVFRNRFPIPFVSSERSDSRNIRKTSRFGRWPHSKRTVAANGFTLVEVLLAMAIIGLVLTPIFAIQMGVWRNALRSSQSLARIFAAKKLLVDSGFELSPDQREKRIEKKLDRPATTMIYDLKKIPENSALKKYKNVLLETVTMQWVDRQGKKRQERLVTFLYKPEVKS